MTDRVQLFLMFLLSAESFSRSSLGDAKIYPLIKTWWCSFMINLFLTMFPLWFFRLGIIMSLALDASMQIYSGDIMENRCSYRPLYEPLSGILSKTVKSEIILVLLSAVLFSLTPFTGRTSSTEPQRLVSLGSLLDDQHWHHVAVERRGSHLNLTVDKHTERVQIPADFSHWSIEQVFSNTERVKFSFYLLCKQKCRR